VVGPIDYCSCFISYSSKDQKFADLLHSQLQSKGARVWLAAEDLKIGDKFRTKIDEAIRLYDKLLLVLSEKSVKSPWVKPKSKQRSRKRESRREAYSFRFDWMIRSWMPRKRGRRRFVERDTSVISGSGRIMMSVRKHLYDYCEI
jgi:hypothetical protein